jgi:hypothetical protein
MRARRTPGLPSMSSSRSRSPQRLPRTKRCAAGRTAVAVVICLSAVRRCSCKRRTRPTSSAPSAPSTGLPVRRRRLSPPCVRARADVASCTDALALADKKMADEIAGPVSGVSNFVIQTIEREIRRIEQRSERKLGQRAAERGGAKGRAGAAGMRAASGASAVTATLVQPSPSTRPCTLPAPSAPSQGAFGGRPARTPAPATVYTPGRTRAGCSIRRPCSATCRAMAGRRWPSP